MYLIYPIVNLIYSNYTLYINFNEAYKIQFFILMCYILDSYFFG